MNVNHFHDAKQAVALTRDEEGFAERSLAEKLDLLVGFELGAFFDVVYVH